MENSVIEIERKKLEPNCRQTLILYSECRKEIRLFDCLHEEGKSFYINKLWKEGREKGVQRLVNSLLIAQTFIEEEIDLNVLKDKEDILDCINLLTDENEEIGLEDGMREKFDRVYPLLIDDDFSQIVSEYKEFVGAIDLVKGKIYRYGESNSGLQDENLLS